MKKYLILTIFIAIAAITFVSYNKVWSTTLSSRWVESLTAWGAFRKAPPPGYWYWLPDPYKEVKCGSGEIITGARFYQMPRKVDEEHVDALCSVTDIDTSTMSVPYWIESNGSTAVCGYGAVMVGLRMYGMPNDVDDEHVDALCANIYQPITQTYSYYVEPNNAYQAITGFKTAQCPSDSVVTGIRFYRASRDVDDEHVDVRCSDINTSKPPTVNIRFQ